MPAHKNFLVPLPGRLFCKKERLFLKTFSNDSGFTLLEVLVAFIIAALALGVLFEGSIGGLKSARVATHYEEALSRAQSHLAALLAQSGFHAGRQSGDDGGGFRWQTQVAPLAVAAVAGPGQKTRPVLYALRVTISWRMDGGKRSVTLRSERLGTTAPGAR
jgi:general secretion pathway protein I